MIALYAFGRDTSRMVLPAAMGKNMPSLGPVEGCVVPPPAFGRHIATTHKSGSAGHLFLVEGSRANGPVLVAVGQDRANDPRHDIAHGQPRPVGVEVVISVCEAGQLHAPSIRMEIDNDVQVEPPKSSSDDRNHG